MTKHYLISGANSGIGRALAEDLAGRGHRVFATAPTEETLESLKGVTENIIPLLLDLRNPAHLAAAEETVKTHTTHLDGLINNAGIGLFGPVELLDMNGVKNNFEINVYGHLAMTQRFLPLLRKAGGARIVFTSSVAGLLSQPLGSCYAATKFALNAFCDGLRMELKPEGISVSVVMPGRIKTPLWQTTDTHYLDDHPLMGPYTQRVSRFKKMVRASEKAAAPVEKVTRVMRRALFSRWPRAKYLVGTDARVISWLRWLPTFLVDRLIMRL